MGHSDGSGAWLRWEGEVVLTARVVAVEVAAAEARDGGLHSAHRSRSGGLPALPSFGSWCLGALRVRRGPAPGAPPTI